MADVVKTIGATGRDYATPALWIASVPANLVTSGNNNYRGECYNDAEFTGATTLLTISGFTTDSTHKVIFTAATGQSFQDHANVRTNALKYNQSNGAGLRTTAAYAGSVIVIDNAYVQVTRLQFKCGGVNDVALNCEGASTGNNLLQDCICQSFNKSAFTIYGAGCLAINLVGFLSDTAGNGCTVKNGAKAIGCMVIRDSARAAAGIGAVSAYSNSTLQSCAFFGFSTVASAANWDTTASKYNATDQASGLPGTNNQHSVTYSSTTPFTSALLASLNLISIASTTLAANGFLDSTNAPNDITGTARTATPTIGAWELATAVTSTFPPVPYLLAPRSYPLVQQ